MLVSVREYEHSTPALLTDVHINQVKKCEGFYKNLFNISTQTPKHEGLCFVFNEFL